MLQCTYIMGGISRKKQNLKLKRQRARQAKLQKLRKQYSQATNTSEKDKIKQKIVRIAPYLAASGALELK